MPVVGNRRFIFRIRCYCTPKQATQREEQIIGATRQFHSVPASIRERRFDCHWRTSQGLDPATSMSCGIRGGPYNLVKLDTSRVPQPGAGETDPSHFESETTQKPAKTNMCLRNVLVRKHVFHICRHLSTLRPSATWKIFPWLLCWRVLHCNHNLLHRLLSSRPRTVEGLVRQQLTNLPAGKTA